MTWRIAESLEVLRRQLNAAFPQRSKLSDGGIGDAAHASRSSDHNPWLKDKNGVGIVTARDFTHDPDGGIDCHWLAKQLVKSRDPRIKYLIWNKQICSSKNSPWAWRPYSGANAHKQHLHISVDANPNLYDNAAPWDLDIAKTEPSKEIFKDLRDDEIKLEIPPAISAAETQAEIPAANIPNNPVTSESSPAPQTVSDAEQPPNTPEPELIAGEISTVTPVVVGGGAGDKGTVVCKERPSSFVRLWTGITAAVGSITAVGVNVQSLFEKATEAITIRQIVFTAFGLGIVALALWFYDKSASRANRLNQQKLANAADPKKINTELMAQK